MSPLKDINFGAVFKRETGTKWKYCRSKKDTIAPSIQKLISSVFEKLVREKFLLGNITPRNHTIKFFEVLF